jgi:serine/threonine-protein kinase
MFSLHEQSGQPENVLHVGQSQLGSGTITGELGEGGMAVVYEIWNEQLGLKRAVKVLKPDFSEEKWNRFKTEMKLMAQLDHSNIITIHSVGMWHGLPYIEMEKVDGWSLHRLIANHGALPA